MNNSKTIPQDTKKLFWTKACSGAYFCILNREFGYPKEVEERASESLASLMYTGNQCGMLWGASLAVGAESFRKHDNLNQAIGVAITTTRSLVESFSKRTKSANCREITRCDFSRNFILGPVKYFITGKFITCSNLGGRWVLEAIQIATEGLSHEHTDRPQQPISCASEVVKKMGASEEEMVMVAGFAGGLGLSGNGCGALGAAIWMHTLARCREGKSTFSNPDAKNTLQAFYSATDSKMLCHEICGQRFATIADHTDFIHLFINVLFLSLVEILHPFLEKRIRLLDDFFQFTCITDNAYRQAGLEVRRQFSFLVDPAEGLGQGPGGPHMTALDPFGQKTAGIEQQPGGQYG